jgi:hypothetical protein
MPPTQDHRRIAARQNLRTLRNQSLLKCIVCAAWCGGGVRHNAAWPRRGEGWGGGLVVEGVPR